MSSDDDRTAPLFRLPAPLGLLLLPMVILLLNAAAAPPATLLTDSKANGDAELKVGYLYHFARFEQWPVEPAGSPLVICVIGKSPLPFTASLATIAGRMVRNWRIAITYISRVEELGACHILFVSHCEQGNLGRILAALGTRPILTVSDLERFVAAEGMIGFVQEGERIRFKINQWASQRAGLRISAQLLKLATMVAE
ncbi:MAG TPA: YfiR family protein [Geomonas sp.]|nr:YfiR family protein [Geomonas sp.]